MRYPLGGVVNGGEQSEACLRTYQSLMLGKLSFLFIMRIRIYRIVSILAQSD